MTDEARELHRIISASVRDMRDMRDAYRIQAQVGPVSEQALEEIIFRAAHPVLARLAPCPAAQRAALLPSVARVMLAVVLEAVAGADGSEDEERARHRSHPCRVSGCPETAYGRAWRT
jgi:hypothetical protein